MSALPPGLEMINDFIGEKEENLLLLYFKEHWSESSKIIFNYVRLVITNDIIKFVGTMKHRQVKHYGYEFDYDNNGVRHDLCNPIPKEFDLVLNAIQSHLKWCPNQITVNKYLPGQGNRVLKYKN